MARQKAQLVFWCVCSVLFLTHQGYAKEKISYTPKDASSKHEPKPESCEIQVFKDSKPQQEYAELGIINYHEERHRANSGSLKLDVAMPKIKAFACKVGGDALIDIRVTEVRRLEFAMFNVRATVVKFSQK
jgi:hypothetical protein